MGGGILNTRSRRGLSNSARERMSSRPRGLSSVGGGVGGGVGGRIDGGVEKRAGRRPRRENVFAAWLE